MHCFTSALATNLLHLLVDWVAGFANNCHKFMPEAHRVWTREINALRSWLYDYCAACVLLRGGRFFQERKWPPGLPLTSGGRSSGLSLFLSLPPDAILSFHFISYNILAFFFLLLFRFCFQLSQLGELCMCARVSV